MTIPSSTLTPASDLAPNGSGGGGLPPGWVDTIDFDAVWKQITERQEADKERRIAPPQVRLWDGNWNLRGSVKKENNARFGFIDNETGVGTLEMPMDYYLSKWMANVNKRKTTNIHVTVDKDGTRWGGRLEKLQVVKQDDGTRILRASFLHDYEEMKHLLVWSNPWLPAEIQFPRLWVLFGRARWALKTTLLCNIMRVESSLFMLPDDPMDPKQWNNFDQSTWSMVVKPDLEVDRSVTAIVHSRFKTMHDVSKNVVADAQLSWECRRYLDGDEPPWEGADLRHGCLVFDLIDKSGWTTGTSFGGDVFGGLLHAFMSIGGDGIQQSQETIPDPAFPDEYYMPGFKGSFPEAPGVVFREGEHSGIQSSEWEWRPATDVGVVAGGHSMPGVNEIISSTIQMIGDLTAMIPFAPPLGGVADAILKPLYTDVFLAFGKWKDPSRARRLGWSHYHEKWADGADSAYTLAWLMAMRTGMWQTRETTRHSLVVADNAPWRVGQRGYGHFFVGDRVGSSAPDVGYPGEIFVDRVSELTLSWDRKTSPHWEIVIGAREEEDPIKKAYEQLQEIFSMLRDLGVL